MANHRTTLFLGRARWTLAIMFLLSAIGLAYEVALTRLFSLMFQYHYVFLIVSVAVAGLSFGAALAALMARSRRTGHAWADLAYAALLLALLLVSTAVVLSQMRSAGRIVVAVAASLLPFVGIGFLNATLFASFAEAGGVLYAADLVGGAVGLGAALGVIGWLGAFDALLVLSVVSAGVAVIFALMTGVRPLRLQTSGVTVLLLAVLVANHSAGWIEFSPRRLADAPPDKTLMAVLKDPSARITATRWGAFARLDLVETSDTAVRYVFTDAGAGSVMVRYTGDDQQVAWLRQEVAYLPFTIAPDTTKNVLILGSGAGKDVLMAHLAGAASITAVEINPELVNLTREYADYNGHIYDLPGVQTEVTDGRNFVERSDRRYDLIYANLVYSQAAAPGNSALAESYIFTREALQTYWDRLADDGRIGFVTHQGIEGLRLLVAGLDMLENNGMTLQDALKHVALASLKGDDPQTRTSVVIIQRQPWTSDTANAFTNEVHNRQAGLLYLPTVMETGLQGLVEGTMNLRTYIKGNADEYNFTPTTDDSPFFFQFTPGLPSQISDLLLISLVLTAIYLSWAMFFFLRRTQHWKRVSLAPYFALLGVAFMLVEIPLIQRFDLLLGEPVLALVAVVGALLVGGGVGSLLSNRIAVGRLPRLAALFTVGVALVALASRVIYPAVIDQALSATLSLRLIVTVIALLPLGFLMGMPFPSGLRMAHRADPEGVAAFWGANAVASVLGSALAMTLAISVGFSAALMLGAALYGLAAVMIFLIWPRLLA
jgi:hypothetical protein